MKNNQNIKKINDSQCVQEFQNFLDWIENRYPQHIERDIRETIIAATCTPRVQVIGQSSSTRTVDLEAMRIIVNLSDLDPPHGHHASLYVLVKCLRGVAQKAYKTTLDAPSTRVKLCIGTALIPAPFPNILLEVGEKLRPLLIMFDTIEDNNHPKLDLMSK